MYNDINTIGIGMVLYVVCTLWVWIKVYKDEYKDKKDI